MVYEEMIAQSTGKNKKNGEKNKKISLVILTGQEYTVGITARWNGEQNDGKKG